MKDYGYGKCRSVTEAIDDDYYNAQLLINKLDSMIKESLYIKSGNELTIVLPSTYDDAIIDITIEAFTKSWGYSNLTTNVIDNKTEFVFTL